MSKIKIHEIIAALEALEWKCKGHWLGCSEAISMNHDASFIITPMKAGGNDNNWHGEMWVNAMLNDMLAICEEQECYFFKKEYVEYGSIEYGINELIEDLKEAIKK